MKFAYEYPGAAVTVDVVAPRERQAVVEVLLIRRGKPPFFHRRVGAARGVPGDG